MPRRNSTVEIKDGKVVFSKEVLEYFESIRTEENSVWIDKYFDYLSDESNLSAEKYNGHHIIPCFTFKDETHRTRKETESLANKVEGNIIKLSIYNHILAHHCLWKIYNNYESKYSIQYTIGKNKEIDGLSENEIKEIAKIQEECAKTNQTEEERKERQKKKYNKANIYKKSHKKQISEQGKRYRESHKEEISKKGKIYRENNKEKIKKKNKENYEKNKDKVSEKGKQLCFDPIENKSCTLNALKCRKQRNKELYKDIAPTQCIIKN